MYGVVGAFVILGGILWGIAAAMVVYAILQELVREDGAVIAALVFIGVSTTTVGVGTLVILGQQILSQLRASQREGNDGGPSGNAPRKST